MANAETGLFMPAEEYLAVEVIRDVLGLLSFYAGCFLSVFLSYAYQLFPDTRCLRDITSGHFPFFLLLS